MGGLERKLIRLASPQQNGHFGLGTLRQCVLQYKMKDTLRHVNGSEMKLCLWLVNQVPDELFDVALTPPEKAL